MDAWIKTLITQGDVLFKKTAELMQAVLIARLELIGKQPVEDFPRLFLELLDIQDSSIYDRVEQAYDRAHQGQAVNVRVNERLTLYFSQGCRTPGPDTSTLYTIGVSDSALLVQVNHPLPLAAFISTHKQLHENGAALFWLFGWEEVRRRLDEFLSAFSETMNPTNPPSMKGPLSYTTYAHLLPTHLRPLNELEQRLMDEFTSTIDFSRL